MLPASFRNGIGTLWRSRGHLVRVALGLFLLVTAGLKIHGLAGGFISEHSFLASPRVQVLAIEIEAVLGLWLLSGWALRRAWAVALLFFAVLVLITTYSMWSGQRSCGCLGQVTVEPWIILCINVGIVALLLATFPRGLDQYFRISMSPVVSTVAGAAVFLILIAGGFLLMSTDPAKALARLRGESLSVRPNVSDVGEGREGEERSFDLQLINYADYPIRIIGGTSNCSCIATRSLPVILLPGETKSLEISIKFVGSQGRFRNSFRLLTDDLIQPVAAVSFSGEVKGESQSASNQ